MRSIRWFLYLGVAALGAAPISAAAQPVPPPASAPVPNSTLDAARALARDAKEHYDAGRFPEAAEGFERADTAYPAPAYRLYLARALAKLGKLSAALRAYERATAMPVPDKAPASYAAAQENAAQELAALRKRVPVVHVVVQGPPDGKVTVTVDDMSVPREAWDHVEVDPGRHSVKIAADGYESSARIFLISEGGIENVEVALKPVAPPVALVPQKPPVMMVPEFVSTPGRGPKQSLLITGGVVAGGGLIAGSILAAMSVSQARHAEALRSDVIAATHMTCPSPDAKGLAGDCAEIKATLQSRVTLGSAAIWSFVGAGAVGAATLVYGVVARRPARRGVRVLPVVGGIRVDGEF